MVSTLDGLDFRLKHLCLITYYTFLLWIYEYLVKKKPMIQKDWEYTLSERMSLHHALWTRCGWINTCSLGWCIFPGKCLPGFGFCSESLFWFLPFILAYSTYIQYKIHYGSNNVFVINKIRVTQISMDLIQTHVSARSAYLEAAYLKVLLHWLVIL